MSAAIITSGLLCGLCGFIVGFIACGSLAYRRAQEERKELTDSFWSAFERAVEAHGKALDKVHQNYQGSMNRYDQGFRANLERVLNSYETCPGCPANRNLQSRGDA